MNKIRILIIAFIVLFIIAVAMFFIFWKPSPKPGAIIISPTPAKSRISVVPTAFLSPTLAPLPTNSTFVIKGVEVKNFYQSGSKPNDVGEVEIARTSDYLIVYQAQAQRFLISILKTPFFAEKEIAERDFPGLLGIPKEKACELTVIITTPYYVDPDQDGKEYMLGFCSAD